MRQPERPVHRQIRPIDQAAGMIVLTMTSFLYWSAETIRTHLTVDTIGCVTTAMSARRHPGIDGSRLALSQGRRGVGSQSEHTLPAPRTCAASCHDCIPSHQWLSICHAAPSPAQWRQREQDFGWARRPSWQHLLGRMVVAARHGTVSLRPALFRKAIRTMVPRKNKIFAIGRGMGLTRFSQR